MEKEYQVVKSPAEARQLRHKGYLIEDIKPNNENKIASVFVFRLTDEFLHDWNKIKNSKRLKKLNRLKYED